MSDERTEFFVGNVTLTIVELNGKRCVRLELDSDSIVLEASDVLALGMELVAVSRRIRTDEAFLRMKGAKL